jgi:hypothetical protein
MTVLMVTFVTVGMVLAAVCIPLILGRIPPNRLYGIRVRKTLEHPEIWYPVNKYGGARLLMSSLLLVMAAIGYTQIPGISIYVYEYAVLTTWIVGCTIGLISSFRYMGRLKVGGEPINLSQPK